MSFTQCTIYLLNKDIKEEHIEEIIDNLFSNWENPQINLYFSEEHVKHVIAAQGTYPKSFKQFEQELQETAHKFNPHLAHWEKIPNQHNHKPITNNKTNKSKKTWSVKKKNPKNLEKHIIQQCYKLTFGEIAAMDYFFKRAIEGNISATTYMTIEENTVLGWILFIETKQGGIIHIFVDENHRQKGIAKSLVEKCIKDKYDPNKTIRAYSGSPGEAKHQLYKHFIENKLIIPS